MSLLDKYKNNSPAPLSHGQLSLSHYERIKRMQQNIRRQKLLAAVKSAITIIVIAATFSFAAYCCAQYNRSFDNCEKLIAEVHANLDTLHAELEDLKVAMNAGGYHD